MEINIERSPQHCCPSEGSNSELFAHENDALTARPQLHKVLREDLALGSHLRDKGHVTH